MASFELKVRRVALVADMAFAAALALLLVTGVARGRIWGPSVALVVLAFGFMAIAHIAERLLRAEPETRREVAQILVQLSNVGPITMAVLVGLVFFTASPMGGGMPDAETPRWLGLPPSYWFVGVAVAMVLGGRYWIHRILHEGREPESNDRFWRSRARSNRTERAGARPWTSPLEPLSVRLLLAKGTNSMASFELKVRRVSVVADVAFLGAVGVAIGSRLVSGHFWVPSVLLVGLTFGYAAVGHFARLLVNADTDDRRLVARSIVWLANTVIAIPVFVFFAAPTVHEPMFSPPPSAWLGIPTGLGILGLGVAMLLIGRVWIHRILHEGREPETNDRFWWSRA